MNANSQKCVKRSAKIGKGATIIPVGLPRIALLFAYSNKLDRFEVFSIDLCGLIDPQSMCGAYKK